MSKVDVNGIHIHYQTRGTGPDVILIHGITSSLAMWYNAVLVSLAADFRVTAYDLRGHGLSGLTESGYSSLHMAQDLEALMDSIGIEKACLVGHSFGGAIALHFALLNPRRTRGIVMLDTGLACLRYLRIIEDWAGWNNRPADMMKNGLRLEQFLELDSKQDVTDIIRHGLKVPRRSGFHKGESGLTTRMEKLLETKMGFEFRDVAGLTEDRLPKIKTPVLALYGETSPYQKMAAHLSTLLENCRHDVLPGAGHFYAVHRPGLVVEKIAGFLRDPEGFVKECRSRPDRTANGSMLPASPAAEHDE